jgi:dsDNA-binding SOS-regulon protein
MDPKATLDALLEAHVDNDYDAMLEHADNLIAWLSKGGFPPHLFEDELGEFIDIFCRMAKDSALLGIAGQP